jgi:cyclomaltodextrinase
VVYYYIFPDRFRNGNPANDPLPGVAKYHDHTVELHANWNDKPYVPGTGDGSDAHYNNDFFGGDLEGIIQKLDYIKDLARQHALPDAHFQRGQQPQVRHGGLPAG